MLRSVYFLLYLFPFFLISSEYTLPLTTIPFCAENMDTPIGLPGWNQPPLEVDLAILTTAYAQHNSGPVQTLAPSYGTYSNPSLLTAPQNSPLQPFTPSKGTHKGILLEGTCIDREIEAANKANLEKYIHIIQQAPPDQTSPCPADPECLHHFLSEKKSLKNIQDHLLFQHLPRAYGCLTCNKTFARKDLLIRHATTSKNHISLARKQTKYTPDQLRVRVAQLFIQQSLPQNRHLKKLH